MILIGLSGGESVFIVEEVCRLWLGEIDLDFEIKLVRLDVVDMDEDEKEMLSEVRVRLVNI